MYSVLSLLKVDLTGIGHQLVASTYQPAEIYISVALLYMIMNLAIEQIFKIFRKNISGNRHHPLSGWCLLFLV